MLECVERLKTLVHTHELELSSVVPGLTTDDLEVDPDCDFCTGACETACIRKLESKAREMITNAHCLAKAQPFSQKRKADE